MKKQVRAFITLMVLILTITATLVSCDETNTPTETTAAGNTQVHTCGATIPSDAKFCPDCGASLGAETGQTPDNPEVSETTEVFETTEAPHAHTWSSWITALDATCTAEGMQERTCYCGEKETQVISALGHTEVIDEAVAATCEKEGKTEGKHCSVCDTVMVKQEKVSATDHTYVDRVCTVCGYFGGSEGLAYSLSKDGTYYSVGNGTCTDEEVYIPSSYKGLPVKDITSLSVLGKVPVNHIKNVYIPDSVTSIGDYAFYGCTGLTSVTIGNSVTSIGDSAFSGCTGLTSITIPDSVTSIGNSAFYKCTSLTSITIPESVTSIGERAFSGCTGLTNVTIPNNVTSIGNDAFYGCTGLTNVTIPNNVTSIGNDAFYGCSNLSVVFISNAECGIGYKTTFPSATIIVSEYNSVVHTWAKKYNYVFLSFDEYSSGCKDLAFALSDDGRYYTVTGIGKCKDSHVVIPCFYNGLPVKAIAKRAFYNCTSITEITIPKTVTDIGTQIFYKADNLHTVYYNSEYSSSDNPFMNIANITKIVFDGDTVPRYFLHNFANVKEVIIGNNVTSICGGAFAGCVNLTKITIGNSVSQIGDFGRVFEQCEKLEAVYISDIAAWCTINCSSDFDNPLYYAHNLYLNDQLVTELIIPNSITSICYAAFSGCTSLTKITISDGVTTIGGSAFNDCTSLTSITIPNSITTIGVGAFAGCTAITSIVIPDSVTSIGVSAFYGCTSLSSVTIGNSVTSIGFQMFYKCTSLTSITIPDSVTIIDANAFYGCTGLTSITIPDSVTSIDFSGCTGLTSITIPDSVTSIDFSSCTNLTSITIPDSVTTIEGAFYCCTGLTSITIPDSVTSIGNSTFYKCTNLKDVYFTGTEAEWNAITIGTNNDYLKKATIHFNSKN